MQVEAKYRRQIKVFYSSTCDSIEQLPGEGGAGIEVRASLRAGAGGGESKGKQKVFRPRLLVGADGLNSTVSVWLILPRKRNGQRGQRGPVGLGAERWGGGLLGLSLC